MEPQAILETLTQRGAVLTIKGDRLNVAPSSVLDDELRRAIKASKRELLALVQAQGKPQVLEPPEPAPANPAWRTPATWNAEIGCWERCGGIVPTAATSENVRRYRESKRAQVLAAPPSPVEVEAQTVEMFPPSEAASTCEDDGAAMVAAVRSIRKMLGEWASPREVHDLAAEIVRVEAEAAAWEAARSPRQFPAEVDAGQLYRDNNQINPNDTQVLEEDETQ